MSDDCRWRRKVYYCSAIHVCNIFSKQLDINIHNVLWVQSDFLPQANIEAGLDYFIFFMEITFCWDRSELRVHVACELWMPDISRFEGMPEAWMNDIQPSKMSNL